jgi:hypothetical protein
MSKIKGITIWEQKAEYFVLGITGIALLVFVGMQFVGNPNAAEVAGRGKIQPGEVDQLLVSEAERLQFMLSPEASPTVDIDLPEPVLPRFEQALTSSVSPSQTFAAARAWVPITTGDTVRGVASFYVPELPAPRAVVTQQFFDTLSENVVDQHERLQSRFTDKPYDVTWITAAAVFDLDRVLEEFRRSGPNGEPSSIPTSWHSDHATVLDVHVEREELVNGQWTNRIKLSTLPGQVSYRNEIEEGNVDAMRRDAILREARRAEIQRQLAQPSFYPTTGSSFIPPDPLNPVVEATTEEVRELQQLRSLERERARLQQQLQELGGSQGTTGPARPGDGRSAPGAGRSGGGSAPAGGGASGDGPADAGSGGMGAGGRGAGGQDQADDGRSSEALINNLNRRIDRLTRRIDALRARIPHADDEPEVEAARLDGRGELVVWSHDLEIEPGSTYRYRLTVELYNPFFARRLNLIDEQQHLADNVVMTTPVSDWSEPVSARAPLHPFITRAFASGQEQGAAARRSTGHAVVEVYRFHDGRWWSAQFNVEPGQRVGAVREEGAAGSIDYGTDWYVLDIIADVDSSGREGRSARVVLQSLRSGEVTEVRHPQRDVNDPVRLQLLDETRLSELAQRP